SQQVAAHDWVLTKQSAPVFFAISGRNKKKYKGTPTRRKSKPTSGNGAWQNPSYLGNPHRA
ncbi:MAG: hypothetical protein ACPGXX_19335, partial [Planctomycetaceae bacterium]